MLRAGSGPSVCLAALSFLVLLCGCGEPMLVPDQVLEFGFEHRRPAYQFLGSLGDRSTSPAPRDVHALASSEEFRRNWEEAGFLDVRLASVPEGGIVLFERDALEGEAGRRSKGYAYVPASYGVKPGKPSLNREPEGYVPGTVLLRELDGVFCLYYLREAAAAP
jgi:hypothetical protein